MSKRSRSTARRKGKYWKKFYHYFCSDCRRERVFVKRIDIEARPRPDNYYERHELIDSWDFCEMAGFKRSFSAPFYKRRDLIRKMIDRHERKVKHE